MAPAAIPLLLTSGLIYVLEGWLCAGKVRVARRSRARRAGGLEGRRPLRARVRKSLRLATVASNLQSSTKRHHARPVPGSYSKLLRSHDGHLYIGDLLHGCSFPSRSYWSSSLRRNGLNNLSNALAFTPSNKVISIPVCWNSHRPSLFGYGST